MVITRGRAAAITLVAVLCSSVHAWVQEVGPPNGSLVVVGSAMQGVAIVERFL